MMTMLWSIVRQAGRVPACGGGAGGRVMVQRSTRFESLEYTIPRGDYDSCDSYDSYSGTQIPVIPLSAARATESSRVFGNSHLLSPIVAFHHLVLAQEISTEFDQI